MKTLKIPSAVGLLGLSLVISGVAMAKERTHGRGTGPVVYVTSQGLYYDSIVVVDSLPPRGRF
jgi:hypothetical protein